MIMPPNIASPKATLSVRAFDPVSKQEQKHRQDSSGNDSHRDATASHQAAGSP